MSLSIEIWPEILDWVDLTMPMHCWCLECSLVIFDRASSNDWRSNWPPSCSDWTWPIWDWQLGLNWCDVAMNFDFFSASRRCCCWTLAVPVVVVVEPAMKSTDAESIANTDDNL